MNLLLIAAAPLAAFLAAWALTPAARWFGRRVGLTAEPLRQRSGQQTVPVFGGAVIVGAAILALALVGHLPQWLMVGMAVLFAVGLIDDAIALRPATKLALESVVITLVTLALLPPIGLTPWPWLDAALVIVWLLATTNAFNLIDGLDGLAAGVGIIAALAIAATALLLGDAPLALVALALAGALAGFLVYNLNPASIFMGDAGALPCGFALGALAVVAGQLPDNSRLTAYAYPLLVMLIPVLDTAIVTVTRLATGRAISRRGLDHSQHRLLSLGLSESAAAAVCWAVAGLAATCAVAVSLLPHAYVVTSLPMFALVVSVVALFMMDLSFETRSPGLAYGYLGRLARLILDVGYKRRLAEAAVDSTLIASAYFGAFLLRLNFEISDAVSSQLVSSLPWVLLVTYSAFIATGIYRGIWRYTGLADLIRFANGAVLAGIFIVLGSIVVPISLSGSIVVLFVLLLLNLLVASRLSFHLLRKGIGFLAHATSRILVVGAGPTGNAAADYIFARQNDGMRLVGFVDDDAFKLGKLVNGEEVLGSIDDLGRVYELAPFNQILIADDALAPERLATISAFAHLRGVPVRRFSIELHDVHSQAGGDSPAAGARVALGSPRPTR